MIDIPNDPQWNFNDRFKILHIINKNKYSSYKAFAEALGLSINTVFKYIHNQGNPGLEVIIRVKQVFPEVNLNWLIAGEGEMFIKEIPKK